MPQMGPGRPSIAKILVIEDNRAQALVTRDLLVKSGHEVTLAPNAASGIKAIKNSPVDVVLVDWVLPDINGKDICRWLKEGEDTRGIPVIMLTSKTSVEDKVSALQAGADDYLAKPYNEIELNARIYAALRTKALRDELGEKNRQLGILLKKIEAMAITDPLTGVYNRRYMEEALDRVFKEFQRYGAPFSILMMDLDHFKSINDEYGHSMGDSVLKWVASIIKGSLREVDVVSRWGGEEFLALLPHTELNSARLVAGRLLQAISGFQFREINRSITLSIGISSAAQEAGSIEQLISQSDSALYQAKKNGRNRVEVFG
jgi:two-component system cell cycle response regulator